jgi:hypothetical protein
MWRANFLPRKCLYLAPKAYTKPWTVTVYQRLTPNTELIEFILQENHKAGPYLSTGTAMSVVTVPRAVTCGVLRIPCKP